MNNITSLLVFLSGKKTYLVVIVALLYILGGKYLKLWPIDGELLAGLGMLAAAFLRAGIAKAQMSIADPDQASLNKFLPTATKEEIQEARNVTRSLVPVLAMALVMACFTGCVTRPVVTTTNGISVTNFVKGPDIEQISNMAGGAAALGSQYWITRHPNDRAYFLAANESLKALIDQKNFDPGAFASALAGLPIKELKGENGTLIVAATILVFNQGLKIADPITRQEMVALTLSKVQAGIQQALDATAPRTLLEREQEQESSASVLMPRWRPALHPAETWALVTFRN